ncbi:hypothetical protein MMC34_005434 [Xylographa carneopallida]|nr:hypothetical protein [Xylographa carneopallida]
MSGPRSTSLDPLVAQTLDTHLLQKSQQPTREDDPASDSDTDSLLDAADPIFASHRAARLQQLSTALSAQKSLLSASHGTVTTLSSEKEVMEIVTATTRTLVHFYHPDFYRCAVMDRHLEAMAPVHVEVRFLRIEAANAAWLSGKLGVRVLPCIVGWVDGKEVTRMLGFEGVGEGCRTADLEEALVRGGLLVRGKLGSQGNFLSHKSGEAKDEGYLGWRGKQARGRKGNDENEDDDDWD